jgi:uncharacterized YccA/Bax inhibitor family protein
MLKPPEQNPPGSDRSIGELIEQVLDDALDYGRTELELLKARAIEIAEDYVRAAILFGVAVVLALAGVITLFVGIAVALGRWIGPFGGAIAAMLFAVGIAGLFAWLALRSLKERQ